MLRANAPPYQATTQSPQLMMLGGEGFIPLSPRNPQQQQRRKRHRNYQRSQEKYALPTQPGLSVEKRDVYIGVDVESLNAQSSFPTVLAIGLCILERGREDDAQKLWFFTYRFVFPVPFSQVDDYTYNGFWRHNRGVYNMLMQESGYDDTLVQDFHVSYEIWRQFAGLIATIGLKYPKSKYNVRFVGDNPGFDIPLLNFGLSLFCEHTIRHLKQPDGSLEYAEFYDPKQCASHWLPQVCKRAVRDILRENGFAITHFPEQDAAYLVGFQLLLDKLRETGETVSKDTDIRGLLEPFLKNCYISPPNIVPIPMK